MRKKTKRKPNGESASRKCIKLDAKIAAVIILIAAIAVSMISDSDQTITGHQTTDEDTLMIELVLPEFFHLFTDNSTEKEFVYYIKNSDNPCL